MDTENLFLTIAREVALSDLGELYVLAGKGFGLMHAPQAVHLAVETAQRNLGNVPAHEVMGRHFNTLPHEQNLHVHFADGISGTLSSHSHAPVRYSVLRLSKGNEATGEMWRVLFSRFDVQEKQAVLQHRLLLMDAKLENIERLVRRIN